MAKAKAGPPGVCVVAGTDSFLAEEALEGLLSRFLGPEPGEPVQVFRGEDASWGRIVEAARTGSLFSPRRAVVVRGADSLKGDGEEIASYLQAPSPDVLLVLLAAKPDRRRSAWKRIFEGAEVVAAAPLKGRSLRAFVVERLKRRNLPLTDDALEELIERVGGDLRRLMGEVDKLEAYAGGVPRSLTAEDVAAVSGHGLAQPLYLLSDAMAARDRVRVLELVEGLLDEGEEGLRILGTLVRSVRQVRLALDLSGSRTSRDEMVRRLGLPPNMVFKLPGILDAARGWTEADLRRALDALRRADRSLKRGAEVRAAVTAAVVGACGPVATGGGVGATARPRHEVRG